MVKRRAPTRENMVILSVAFEKNLHRRLAISALDANASMNELIREAVREWLHRHDRRKK